MDDTNRLADYISELKNLPNWKSTHHTEKSRGKPARMAERSKAPDARNSFVENSGLRVCAWVRIPILSENVLNTTRQSLQLTNSVILERQFKMTVQSKRKQTTRNAIGWLIAEWFKNAQKRKKIPSKDMWNTKVHVGFDENLFKWMTQTASQITSLNWKNYPIEKAHIIQKKVEASQARWPSGLRRQTQESRSSRILVHECVRGFESQSCQKTFWTRRGRAFSWQILSYWNVNSRWQSKAKENKRLATSLGGW